ncbi:MAG: SDR family oxidoreductase [Ruminococcus sp.]|nr:SDR family oxidoreductase [Ruminococcus sp.]
MMNIRGKWALVTGASRGIGALAAEMLAESGCNLILHSRKPEHTEEIAAKAAALGVEVRIIACELSDLKAVEGMLKEIDAMDLSVDIVLNNAGVQIAYRTDYYETPAEDYMTSFVINTIAPMMICYHFLPGMTERGFGRIVNTTSGIRLEPEQAGYSASKAALDKVTVDLSSKLNGTNVILSLADPGWCRTDLGGPNAPNAPEHALPGVIVGVFVNDGISGRLFSADAFAGMSLEKAVELAEAESGAFLKNL